MVLALVYDFLYKICQERERKTFYNVNFHDGSCSFRVFNLANITNIVELLTDEI